MFDEIKDKIKNKGLIIFGEVHGTKEIPEMLSQFFSEIAKEEDFNVCLEIPEEFQENPYNFFKMDDNEISDGRNSLEYFNLISKLKILNKKYNKNIKLFCVDPIAHSQEEKEDGLAKNILKSLSGKKTFAIIGNIHAYKKIINLAELKITTSGSIVSDNLNYKMFSINISPKKGEFFNFGLHEIHGQDNSDKDFNKGFDYVLEIKKVSSCSFLK